MNAGAEMLVIIAGEIMRMPGLPKEPQALHIDIVNGEIEGCRNPSFFTELILCYIDEIKHQV